jgi:hypothetical protein
MTMIDIKTASEKELREHEAMTPTSPAELAGFVQDLVGREHDYGTCVYAMSLAAVAAFNYVASKLGVTGFQASCADMDIIARTRGLKHGFMILDASQLLYPQYDLVEKVAKFCNDTRKRLAPEARRLLAESDKEFVHPEVSAHWEKLAKLDACEAQSPESMP